MKILHYLDRYDITKGGVVEFVGTLCKNLAHHGQGCDISLLMGENIEGGPKWNSGDGFPKVISLQSPPKRQGYLTGVQMLEIKPRIAEADVIHLHGAWDFGNYQIASLAKVLGKPFVASPHGMLDDWPLNHKWLKKSVFLQLVTKRYFRSAAIIHCTSEGEKSQTTKNISNLPPVVCAAPVLEFPETHPLPNVSFPSTKLLDSSKPKLLFLGRIHLVKGLEYLIDACAILRQRAVSFQLILAGPGDERYVAKLKKQIWLRGIEQDVVWVGIVRDEEKDALYRSCDIFVLPTLHENFGIVLAEAALAGLPLVTTRHTNIHQELQTAGAEIAGLSGEELAKKIQVVINNHPAFLGNKIQAHVRKWLNKETVISTYVDIYRQAKNSNSQVHTVASQS